MDIDLLDGPTTVLPVLGGGFLRDPVIAGSCPHEDGAVRLRELREDLAAPLAALRAHRVWQLAARPDALRLLMEHHVYCVWDFMSLVKALQSRLTCVTVPWVPCGSPVLRRFVNQIVCDEESDEIDGEPVSHFELYLQAMAAMRADGEVARRFVHEVVRGREPIDALERAGAPDPARRFVAQTFEVIARGRIWEIAAAFTFGREEAIPAMFAELVRALPGVGRCAAGVAYDSRALRTYLERHIDIDGGTHAPLAHRLMLELCGDDPERWREAGAAARAALAARHALWDAVAARIGACA
jgi:hypothetical protein